MKRVKSCSTLRLKVHQLLNEEEREILKYAIRIYRKNQSIDSLCDILSKIITDSNRSCLVTLIADMLKDEQRSQFLSRCCMKMPGYSVSQHQLERTDLSFSNNEYKSNTFSIRVATFVSKNKSIASKSNLNLTKSSSKFDDNDSTLKAPKGKIFNSESNNNDTFKRSDSEELLKTIEKCTIKERPALSNLQDKGFWKVNSDSPTDNDSIDSSSSAFDGNQSAIMTNGEKPTVTLPQTKQTPRFYSNNRHSNFGLTNGTKNKTNCLNSGSRKFSNPNSKVMICKLHFSSVNSIEDTEESVDEIPAAPQSLATVFFNVNSSDNFFVQYQHEVPNYMNPTRYKSLDQFKCQSIDENMNVFSLPKTIPQVNSNPSLNKSFSEEIFNNHSTDVGCQTYPTLTCDTGTQTFLA